MRHTMFYVFDSTLEMAWLPFIQTYGNVTPLLQRFDDKHCDLISVT